MLSCYQRGQLSSTGRRGPYEQGRETLHEEATKIRRNEEGQKGAAGAFGCAKGKEKRKSIREKVRAVASAAASRARRPRARVFDVVKIHGLRALNQRPFCVSHEAGARSREAWKTPKIPAEGSRPGACNGTRVRGVEGRAARWEDDLVAPRRNLSPAKNQVYRRSAGALP